MVLAEFGGNSREVSKVNALTALIGIDSAKAKIASGSAHARSPDREYVRYVRTMFRLAVGRHDLPSSICFESALDHEQSAV